MFRTVRPGNPTRISPWALTYGALRPMDVRRAGGGTGRRDRRRSGGRRPAHGTADTARHGMTRRGMTRRGTEAPAARAARGAAGCTEPPARGPERTSKTFKADPAGPDSTSFFQSA
ncbi:hypothetical protein Pve01_08160 [Planomonospora venezuelensis]|nr:hypothetical protein Pve01_08160 [Planomonospora venezuelensis]